MSKNNHSLPLTIECSYCGSVFDYSEHRSCPNCAAIPDKAQINAAKAEARAAAKAEAEAKLAAELKLAAAKNPTAVPPTGKLMKKLIKLIPVWIVFILAFIWIPDIKIRSDEKKIVQNLQIIEEPEYKEQQLGVPFIYDNFFEVTVDEFNIADSEAVNALLPEGYKLLTVHITASSDGTGAVNDYYEITPYISLGNVCREPVSPSSMRSLPDVFASNSFYFTSSKYDTLKDGYLCFIIEENTETLELCFEETHMKNKVRQLDLIHKIKIDPGVNENG